MEFPLDEQRINPGQAYASRYATAEPRPRPRHDIRAGSSRTIRNATLITMLGMFLSKGTGFLRELLIIPKFGYGIFSDAYVNAFQIPDLLYEFLVGGVVAAVLTPVLSSGIEQGRQRSAWRAVSIFATLVFLLSGGALLLAELLAGPLMNLITGAPANASGDLRKMIEVAVPATRILLLQSFLMILVALLHGVLSAYKRFTPIALGPTLYNFIYMLALFLFGAASLSGVMHVAWGVVFAAFLYFLYQAMAARHWLGNFRFSLDFHDPGFLELLRRAIPTILSGSILYLSNVVINRYANGLGSSGAVTAIRQCLTIWGLPYAIFPVAIGNVMLPNLAGFYARGDAKRVRSLYSNSLRKALFLVTPFALSFAVMSFETIQAIFQWNPQTYSNQQIAGTAPALQWFCLTIVGQSVVFITNQAFYARKMTRTALFTGLMALILNAVFLEIFLNGMSLGLAGIGMAHAAYSVLTAVILYLFYAHHRRDMRPRRLFPFLIRLAFCSACMWFVLAGFNRLPLYPQGKFAQLLLYGIKFLLGFLSYYCAGIAIRFREAWQVQDFVRGKLGLARIE